MIRHRCCALLALVLAVIAVPQKASAVLLVYDPFSYAEGTFFASTTVDATNTSTSPVGSMAPNFNNWYGTGIDAAVGYQTVNDGQVVSADLYVPGISKPPTVPRSLLLGQTGYTMRLSLNTSTLGQPNRTGPNVTDTADPLAGTDATLQATDTGGTAYYSIAFRVGSIATLNSTGGVLLGFNNVIGAQPLNPITTAAGLTIRPKSGGNGAQFELGVVKQGATNFAAATWDSRTFDTSSTIFVVGKYQTVGLPQNTAPPEKNDIASLWINPSTTTFGGFEPGGAITNTAGDDVSTSSASNNHTLQSFILRQTGSSANNQVPIVVMYDELRVGTTWADVTPGIAGDYNGDGKVDTGDYVMWRKGGSLQNEVDTRGVTNSADYTAWRARFGDPILGDYNSDGLIDAADYVMWRKGGPLANEVDNPGTVDNGDYAAWRERFSGTIALDVGSSDLSNPHFGNAAGVPEPPVGFYLLAICAAGLIPWRTGR